MKYKCALISRASLLDRADMGRQSNERRTILTHNSCTRNGENKFKSINFSLEMLALSTRLSAIHLLGGMSRKVEKNAAKVIYGKLGALPIVERLGADPVYVFDRRGGLLFLQTAMQEIITRIYLRRQKCVMQISYASRIVCIQLEIQGFWFITSIKSIND